MRQSPGFSITGMKGFHITFANGWTVSVQFGPGNYCDNYDRQIGSEEKQSGKEGSSTAEVAAWGEDGKMIAVDGDSNVKGRVSPEEVLALLNDIAARPTTA